MGAFQKVRGREIYWNKSGKRDTFGQDWERMALDIFSDLFVYDTLPECRVIVNRGTPNEGLARTENSTVPARNGANLKVVSEIREISLRKELFCRDAFPEAMVVYMHELLHQFGGDARRQFRTAILAMNYRIMESSQRLEVYEKEWVELTIKKGESV